MANTSLDSLIRDLDYIEKNFDSLFSEKYDDIMSKVILLIGQTTAYDTGVSRDIIKSILVDLGKPDLQSELEHKVYNFWKTRKHREQDKSKYTFNKTSDGHYYIDIEDYGIEQQNIGYVSFKHPRKDSKIIPYHIEEALDKLETKKGDDGIISAFNDLESFICKCIARGV